MKASLIILFCCLAVLLPAQEKTAATALTAGFELDLLPYATGGYFGAIWVGKGHWRSRLIVARATKPDFLLPDGFSENHIRAYALLADYFPKSDFRAWWLAAGLVYWDASIRHDSDQYSEAYKSYLLSGGTGYNWKFFRNFYLSPWIGLHIRIAGDANVSFQTENYQPPRFNPEGSLKVGWHF